MRRALVLCLLAAPAFAREPPLPSADHEWSRAIEAAGKELATCVKLGEDNHVFGDVIVTYDRHKHAWKRSPSKSLGWAGDKIAACVQDAIARHYKDDSIAESFDNTLEHIQAIGEPRVVLPPLAKLLAAKSRGALAKLLPPDYTLDAHGCFATDRTSIERAEELWLAATGAAVPRVWNPLLGDVSVARYVPGTLVTRGRSGLCFAPVDAAALRTRMEQVASCLQGSFEDVLLHPRWAFPATAFTQVSTQTDHACALSAAGEITCCGPALPPPPKGPFTQVATGGTFGCALDAKGAATCWGKIAPPPAGAFAKLSAAYDEACAIRTSGEIVCWGATRGTAPAGAFTDVAAAELSSCAVAKDHAVQCWGEPSRAANPPGSFTQVAATWTHACGVHTDGTLGCWRDGQVDTPLPGTFAEVAVGDTFRVCARSTTGTLACTQGPPPPAGTFTQLTGDRDTFCAVSTDHHVACWGKPWPGDEPAPPPPPKGPHVVDENGHPIAGAEVLACADLASCHVAWRQTTWSTETLAHLSRGAKDVAITTTRADGTWSTPIHPADVVVTAPGREAILTNQLDEIVLRPAASLDIDAHCPKTPCGALRVAVGPLDWHEGTHVARLAPGTHLVEVTSKFGEPGEQRGVATVTVTFAGGALEANVQLAPIGTGKTIRGTAEIDGHPLPRAMVTAICERPTPSEPILRKATADDHGDFVLDDVGAAPCRVDLNGPNAYGQANVDRVPADHVKLHGERPPSERIED